MKFQVDMEALSPLALAKDRSTLNYQGCQDYIPGLPSAAAWPAGICKRAAERTPYSKSCSSPAAAGLVLFIRLTAARIRNLFRLRRGHARLFPGLSVMTRPMG